MKRILLIFYLFCAVNLSAQEYILDPINNGILDSLAAHYGLIQQKVAIIDSNVSGGYATFDFARNASNLALGTIPTGRLSGSYTGITGLGTVIAGVWNGTGILDAYVDNDLTINTTKAITGKSASFSPSAGTLFNEGVRIYRGGDTTQYSVINSVSAWTNLVGVIEGGTAYGGLRVYGSNNGSTSLLYAQLDNTGTAFYYPTSLGKNAGTSGSLTFIASDNDQQNILSTTSDELWISGASGGLVLADATAPLFKLRNTTSSKDIAVFAEAAGNGGYFEFRNSAGTGKVFLSTYGNSYMIGGDVIFGSASTDNGAYSLQNNGAFYNSGSATFGGVIKATLSTYADDAAAGTGGLTAGQFYQTATGELRIKL